MTKKIFFIVVLPLFAGSFFFACRKEQSCEGCNGNTAITNKPPVAITGRDTIITLPLDSVTLEGNASYDPDGSIATYLWSKISGPSSFTITQPQASHTIIKNLVAGSYEIELKVTDNKGLFAKDTILIIVDAVTTTNHPPVANAGADQTITLPTNSIVLSGSGSSDPDNNITAYAWLNISGPSTAMIGFPNAVQVQVASLTQGVYQFELKVTDAGGLFSRDTVQVIVNSTPPPVVCGNNRHPANATMTAFGMLSKPRGSIAVASAGNKILFAGGCTSTEPGMSRVDIYDIPTNTWSTAELSVPRYGITAIANGNKIFFAGGVSGELGDIQFFYSTVDVYDVTTNSWSVTSLNEPVAYATAAAVDDKVLFAGGEGTITIGATTYYGYRSNKINIYDISAATWSTELLSEGRASMAAVTLNNKVYFAGGDVVLNPGMNNFITYISDNIDIYDHASNTVSVSTLTEPTAGLSGMAIAGKIYWAGGANSQGSSCKVEIRDPGTQTTSFDYLSQPAFVTAVLKDNNIAYHTLGDYFDIYNTLTNTWSIGIMPIVRYGASIISVNNIIYMAGGAPTGSTNYSMEVWKLDF